MEKTFLDYGINLSKIQIEKFEIFYRLLIEYNAKFNLTAITEREDVIKKHFIDSVLGVDKLCGKDIIDVGSGGGFPAIPLKIVNDDINLTMLEATGKKCDFLREVVKELSLSNVLVINGRAEEIAKEKDFRERFSTCTARAVARLNTLCEYCLPFVKVGGVFIAYKGDSEQEVLESKNAFKVLGGKLKESFSYDFDGAKRALISIEKILPTPDKYPRGNGKERKNPL